MCEHGVAETRSLFFIPIFSCSRSVVYLSIHEYSELKPNFFFFFCLKGSTVRRNHRLYGIIK